MNAPESEVLKVELLPIDDEHDIGFIACLTIDRPRQTQRIEC